MPLVPLRSKHRHKKAMGKLFHIHQLSRSLTHSLGETTSRAANSNGHAPWTRTTQAGPPRLHAQKHDNVLCLWQSCTTIRIIQLTSRRPSYYINFNPVWTGRVHSTSVARMSSLHHVTRHATPQTLFVMVAIIDVNRVNCHHRRNQCHGRQHVHNITIAGPLKTADRMSSDRL